VEKSNETDMMWAIVRDMAIQHWKFENEDTQAYAFILSLEPVKPARMSMGSMLSLYMVAAREDHSYATEGTGNSVQKKKDILDAAIEQYRPSLC
jgi:hypothetical protein